MSVLEIENLHVSVEGKQIIKGLGITIRQGEIHVLMGPNGSGKSTLAMAVMGHPKYSITEGSVVLDGENITNKPVDERAKKGLFLSFQHPVEVPGVGMMNFLRMIGPNVKMCDFRDDVKKKMSALGMGEGFSKRYLNDGFSGGEKKRSEMLQMAMREPKIAILDEIDSGLDMDALKDAEEAIRKAASGAGILIITHYDRMLKHIKPDYVHVIVDGKIVRSGGAELAKRLEEDGYEGFGREL